MLIENSSFLEVLVAEIIVGWHEKAIPSSAIDSNFLFHHIRLWTHRPGLGLVDEIRCIRQSRRGRREHQRGSEDNNFRVVFIVDLR